MGRAVGVEPQRAGQRLEHLWRGPPVAPLLQPHQVRDADAGQGGQLVAPQTGHAPAAARRHTGRLGRQAAATRLQVVAEPVVDRHTAKVTPMGSWLTGRPAATLEVMASKTKTWFITGASRGFGRAWTQAALERGDRVAATARDISALDDLAAAHPDALLPLTLDVTDRAAAFAAVAAAHEHFGRLDVIVNNAGYGLFGAIEEVDEAQARAQLDTNLLGPLWVTQAALPILRGQGAGHILQVSSIGGVAAFPLVVVYNASKWGLEGFSEALAAEVAPHGIKVTLIEPGPYATDWAGSSGAHATPIAAYDDLRAARADAAASRPAPGPEVTTDAVLAVVDADEPPLRLFLGAFPLPIAERAYADRLAAWRAWQSVSERAA